MLHLTSDNFILINNGAVSIVSKSHPIYISNELDRFQIVHKYDNFHLKTVIGCLDGLTESEIGAIPSVRELADREFRDVRDRYIEGGSCAPRGNNFA